MMLAGLFPAQKIEIHHSPEVRIEYTTILDTLDKIQNRLVFLLRDTSGQIH